MVKLKPIEDARSSFLSIFGDCTEIRSNPAFSVEMRHYLLAMSVSSVFCLIGNFYQTKTLRYGCDRCAEVLCKLKLARKELLCNSLFLK